MAAPGIVFDMVRRLVGSQFFPQTQRSESKPNFGGFMSALRGVPCLLLVKHFKFVVGDYCHGCF